MTELATLILRVESRDMALRSGFQPCSNLHLYRSGARMNTPPVARRLRKDVGEPILIRLSRIIVTLRRSYFFLPSPFCPRFFDPQQRMIDVVSKDADCL